MLRGPTFRLFGVPTRIEFWFLLTALFFGMASRREGWWLLEWMVVITFSVLVHELGHAFAYKRYHQQPSIVLTGLVGLTYGERELPPKRRIVVSFAGPGAELVLLGIPAWIALQAMPLLVFDNYVAFRVLDDLRFINLVWALVNLLPMLPLDGGNILDAALELRNGGPRRQVARMVSVVTGVSFGIFAVAYWGSTFGLVFGFVIALFNFLQWWQVRNGTGMTFGLSPDQPMPVESSDNVVSMRKERAKRDRRSSADLLRDGWAALERREYKQVQRIGARLAGKRLSGETANQAAELAAWGWLGDGNVVAAEEALGRLPRNARPSRALSAVLLLSGGRGDDAMKLMLDVMVNGPDGIARLVAVDFFAERGMTHRLARELVDLEGGKGFEACVALEGMLHRLHRTQDASTVSDVILLG